MSKVKEVYYIIGIIVGIITIANLIWLVRVQKARMCLDIRELFFEKDFFEIEDLISKAANCNTDDEKLIIFNDFFQII